MWIDDSSDVTIDDNLIVTGSLTAGSFVPPPGDTELLNGSVSAPSLFFQSDVKSGMYWDTAGTPGMAFTAGGTKKMKIDTSLITITEPVLNTSSETVSGTITGGNFVETGTTASTFTGPIGLPDSNSFPTGTTLYATGDTTSGLSIDTSDQITNKTVFNLISSGSSVFQTGKGFGTFIRTPLFSQNINAGTYSLSAGTTSVGSLTSTGQVTADSYIGTGTTTSTFTGPITTGTVKANNYNFIAGTNSGLSFNTTGSTVDTSVGGSTKTSLSSTSMTTSVPVFAGSGSQTSPTYSFTNSTNSGMYEQGAPGSIGISSLGLNYFTVGGLQVQISTNASLGFTMQTLPMTCGALSCSSISTGGGTLSAGSSTVSGLNVTGLTASQLVTTDSSKNLTSTLTMPVGVLWSNYKQTQQIPAISGGTLATTGTYTLPSGCTSIRVRLQAPGAGGGSVTSAAGSAGGGGGAGGGYCELFIASPLGTYAWSVAGFGAGGSGGAAGGSASAATTFGTSLLSIPASLGGNAGAPSVTPTIATGGSAGNPTGGDFNISGNSGGLGVGLSSTVAWGGSGGAGAVYGEKHQEKTVQGGGFANSTNGAGGGGGCVINGGAAVSGAAGSPGFLWVEEFYNM